MTSNKLFATIVTVFGVVVFKAQFLSFIPCEIPFCC